MFELTKGEEKVSSPPKYLPYSQMAMGMIQPEWIFMSHLFEDREEEEPEVSRLSNASVLDKKEAKIQIHFHARQER